jgi:hypothetical protein
LLKPFYVSREMIYLSDEVYPSLIIYEIKNWIIGKIGKNQIFPIFYGYIKNISKDLYIK